MILHNIWNNSLVWTGFLLNTHQCRMMPFVLKVQLQYLPAGVSRAKKKKNIYILFFSKYNLFYIL